MNPDGETHNADLSSGFDLFDLDFAQHDAAVAAAAAGSC